MIKNTLRKLLPPRGKTQEKDTRFEKALRELSSEQKSMLISFFSQWILEDKTVTNALKRSPQELQKAWIAITEDSNRELLKKEIIDDFRRYMTKITDEGLNMLTYLQARTKNKAK